MAKHPIFNQYRDYCKIKPLEDKSWTVGTEHRQLQLYEPELSSPRSMKKMMVDNVKRRMFIIDADIKVNNKIIFQEKNLCSRTIFLGAHDGFNVLPTRNGRGRRGQSHA